MKARVIIGILMAITVFALLFMGGGGWASDSVKAVDAQHIIGGGSGNKDATSSVVRIGGGDSGAAEVPAPTTDGGDSEGGGQHHPADAMSAELALQQRLLLAAGQTLPPTPHPTAVPLKGGLVRVVGDASAKDPPIVVLRPLTSVPVEVDDEATPVVEPSSSATSQSGGSAGAISNARSFLESDGWRTLALNSKGGSRWKVTYNRDLSRRVPGGYVAESQKQSAFFAAIDARGVLPNVANSSLLVDGPLDGPHMVQLKAMRGLTQEVVGGGEGGATASNNIKPVEPRRIKFSALPSRTATGETYTRPIPNGKGDEEVEAFEAIATSNSFAETLDDLEYVKTTPAVYSWLRPLKELEARWARKEDEAFSKRTAPPKEDPTTPAPATTTVPPTSTTSSLLVGDGAVDGGQQEGAQAPPTASSLATSLAAAITTRTSTTPRPTIPRRSNSRSAVRVACLYAGFVRDYVRMYQGCMEKTRSRRKCSLKLFSKLYGSQRENIIDGSGCDVYISTWDIVGSGRYDVKDYKMDQKISVPQIRGVYGDRLGGLHVQEYSVYERVWKYMAVKARSFPQTRPTVVTKLPATWRGKPENNFFFRVNDYSQSYKHWCVVQLALLSGFNYDLFFRLRMDLRAVREVTHFRFATIVDDADDDVKNNRRLGDADEPATIGGDKANTAPAKLERRAITYNISSIKGESPHGHEDHVTYTTHFVTHDTMHVQNFDYADFGFMATPSLIHAIAAVWYYCLMPPVLGMPVQYLGQNLKPGSEVISEYNLVVWRIIFENQLKIDDGAITLRISRRAGITEKMALKKRKK